MDNYLDECNVESMESKAIMYEEKEVYDQAIQLRKKIDKIKRTPENSYFLALDIDLFYDFCENSAEEDMEIAKILMPLYGYAMQSKDVHISQRAEANYKCAKGILETCKKTAKWKSRGRGLLNFLGDFGDAFGQMNGFESPFDDDDDDDYY